MNMNRTEELINIVNSLSNDDLMFIMNVCSDRITVYVGSYKRHMISYNGIDCCSNGCLIQINAPDRGEENSFDLEKQIQENNKFNEFHNIVSEYSNSDEFKEKMEREVEWEKKCKKKMETENK